MISKLCSLARPKMSSDIIVMAIIAVALPPVTTLTSSLSSVAEMLKAQVLKEEPKCTNLVVTTDSSFSESYSNSIQTEPQTQTYFYVNLHSNRSGFEPLATLHYQPCSIVLLSLDSAAPLEDGATNFTAYFNNYSPLPYAGSLHSAFYFFIFPTPENVTAPEGQEAFVLEFAKTTRELQNAFFLLDRPDGALDIFGRDAFANSLRLIWTFSNELSLVSSNLHLVTQMDFQGEAMIGTVCPICDKPLEYFKETGDWYNKLAATMYQLAVYANATLEFATVFGAPKTGVTLEGDWDGFLVPLIEGTAVMTQLMEQTVENRRVVFSSRMTLFDNVAFITDKAKRLRYTSLARLAKPLRLNVWVAIGLSFLCIFIALETMIENSRMPEHGVKIVLPKWENWSVHSTAYALAVSAMDQCSVTGNLADKFHGNSTRFLISLWYILWIVVGCAYKSDLTGMIVKPVYVQPPTTFTELVESDYKLGVLFYSGNLEENFMAWNTSVSRAIQARKYEYDFLEPDCYLNILKEESVCIGPALSMPPLSWKYLIDIRGRPMYLMSKEGIFQLMFNFGVSKSFPALLAIYTHGVKLRLLKFPRISPAPLNSFITWLECTGIYALWHRKSEEFEAKVGQAAGKKFYEENKLYDGEEVGDEQAEAYSKIVLYGEVLGLGLGVSAAVFMAELCASVCSSTKRCSLVEKF